VEFAESVGVLDEALHAFTAVRNCDHALVLVVCQVFVADLTLLLKADQADLTPALTFVASKVA